MKKPILSKEELCYINFFDNLDKKESKSKDIYMNQSNDFIEKLSALRLNKNILFLYDRLIKIQDILGEKHTIKYLENYLEYHSLTFDDLISK